LIVDIVLQDQQDKTVRKFQMADDKTFDKNEVKNIIRKYLSSLKKIRGIHDYKVINENGELYIIKELNKEEVDNDR